MSPRVLRLCSVFEPTPEQWQRPQFDPIGGMQNHTAALTRALDAQGVRQTVITSRLGGSCRTDPFAEHSEVVRVGLPMRRLRQAWAPAAYRAALQQMPPDVVHVHQGEDLAVLPLGRALARRWRVPLIVTLHCSLRHSVPRAGARLTLLRSVGGAIEEHGVRSADTVITLTDTTAARLSGVQRLEVIPSGFEPAIFADAAPDADIAAVAGPRILYLGRFAQQKDVPTLVAAFGRLRTRASLVLVGDGPERPAVDAAVAALPAEVQARVHRLGFRPHDQVPSALAAADLLVLPSVYEEMGSVLAEAMCAGLPVVASAVGGIPDVVDDGRTGLLVRPRDVAGFATAIDGLLAEPARLAAMRAASTARCADYAWNRLGARVLGVYDDALAASAARRSSVASAAAVRSML